MTPRNLNIFSIFWTVRPHFCRNNMQNRRYPYTCYRVLVETFIVLSYQIVDIYPTPAGFFILQWYKVVAEAFIETVWTSYDEDI